MCLSVTVITLLLFIKTKADSVEHGDHFNTAYAPPTVNFNEIFTNSLSLLSEEPTLTTGTKDEDFHLNNIPSQFVEFRPQKVEVTTTPTPPPPMYLLNSSYLKKENETEEHRNTTSTTAAAPIVLSTEAPQENSVKVIPIKKNYQRGVLDLLFPASRVRAFKGVFDTFRRILSHTFRRR
ncbi:uncharacterized protein LOC114359360 [Ostrinia furnacalis]|uniref:uncharacterized protein LOC114359360 n=1 Tax=Ostrinia furnacalis TaxID=93504 RepID=UPI00103DA06A|nr:uncharacterized protein LOC114359360 [Ostrinia furnacalis]